VFAWRLGWQAHDDLVKGLKEELSCRRFFREQFKEFEQCKLFV
jgi:hypothetical protein